MKSEKGVCSREGRSCRCSTSPSTARATALSTPPTYPFSRSHSRRSAPRRWPLVGVVRWRPSPDNVRGMAAGAWWRWWAPGRSSPISRLTPAVVTRGARTDRPQSWSARGSPSGAATPLPRPRSNAGVVSAAAVTSRRSGEARGWHFINVSCRRFSKVSWPSGSSARWRL